MKTKTVRLAIQMIPDVPNKNGRVYPKATLKKITKQNPTLEIRGGTTPPFNSTIGTAYKFHWRDDDRLGCLAELKEDVAEQVANGQLHVVLGGEAEANQNIGTGQMGITRVTNYRPLMVILTRDPAWPA